MRTRVMFRKRLNHAGARIAKTVLATMMLWHVCCLAQAISPNQLAITASAGESPDCHDETPNVPQSPATPDHHCCVHSQGLAALLAAYDLPQLDVTTYRPDIATLPLAVASNRLVEPSSSTSPPGLSVMRISISSRFLPDLQ